MKTKDYIFTIWEADVLPLNYSRNLFSVNNAQNSESSHYKSLGSMELPGFHCYSTGPDGVRKRKVQTFGTLTYQTERDVRLAVTYPVFLIQP